MEMKKIIVQKNIDDFLDDDYNSSNVEIPRKFSAPISLIWEITGKCNSNCIYCSGGFPKHIDEMSKEDKIKLAKEICSMKVFMISLSGGEPLINDDLLDIVKIFLENNVSVMVCTSGYNINYNIVNEILKLKKVAFNISIDSVNASINDFQRGRQGALNESLKLINYIRTNEQTHTFISIEAVATKKNYVHMSDLVEFFVRNYDVNEIRIQPVVTMNKEVVDKGLSINAKEFEACMSKVNNCIEKINEQVDKHKKEFVCVRFVDQFKLISNGIKTGRTWGGIITPNGDFLLSVYLPSNLGNVHEMGDFQNTWDKKFSNGWELVKLNKEINLIKNVYDLKKLYVKDL